MTDETAAVVAAVDAVAERIEAERDHLTELDSAVGDADHGGNMARGWAEAAEAARDLDDPSVETVVRTVGKTLMAEVGGASGPLYGGSLALAADELDGGLTADNAVAFAETYFEKVQDRGDAEVGDATMVDALAPAVHTFKKSVETDELAPVEALAKAVAAAERGTEFTVPVRAAKGRASYLGWRSVGHQDPGATSTLYIAETLLEVALDRADVDLERPVGVDAPTAAGTDAADPRDDAVGAEATDE